jgi:hypothetical protein
MSNNNSILAFDPTEMMDFEDAFKLALEASDISRNGAKQLLSKMLEGESIRENVMLGGPPSDSDHHIRVRLHFEPVEFEVPFDANENWLFVLNNLIQRVYGPNAKGISDLPSVRELIEPQLREQIDGCCAAHNFVSLCYDEVPEIADIEAI